jgi:hypothetical protein
VLDALQVKFYDLVERTAVELAKDFGEGETSGDRSDERGADCLAGEERNAAPIELAAFRPLPRIASS